MHQQCKPEPIVPPPASDPDSLYVSTPYIVAKPFRFPTITHPYKDSLSYEGIELGRRLFYDVNLSASKISSCGSCHKQQYAFADSGVVYNTPIFGATGRNTPSLQNLIWSQRLFWDGRAATVLDAINLSLQHHLSWNPEEAVLYLKTDSTYKALFKKAFGRPGDITAANISLAIQQFILALVSADSRFDKIQRLEQQFTSSEAGGFQIFLTETADCYHCHSDGVTLIMTDNLFRNIGLDSVTDVQQFTDKGRGAISGNANDNGKFKTASLRNVLNSPPYMHDGRFQNLEDVVEFYSTGQKPSPNLDVIMQKANHANGGLQLSVQQKADMVAFLKTLTDTAFLSNPRFSNPF